MLRRRTCPVVPRPRRPAPSSVPPSSAPALPPSRRSGPGLRLAMWRPPRPASTAARDLDQDAHRPEGDLDQSGIGSMRHRVVPPIGVDGWKAQGLFIGEQVTDEEVCTGETHYLRLSNPLLLVG